jgi:hypothetical protein
VVVRLPRLPRPGLLACLPGFCCGCCCCGCGCSFCISYLIIISACVPCNIIYIYHLYIYIMARDGVEKSWSIGSEAGGEEVCAYNEDDVPTVDKIRLRWQVCDGTEGFSETRSMRLKAI